MEDDQLYELPEFLNGIRESGERSVVASVESDVGGLLYHHRGIRMPGYDAVFECVGEDTFTLVVDCVGDRTARVEFDLEEAWDFYLLQPPEDSPYLTWICDAEFEADDADEFDSKAEAVGQGRFSFGLSLQPTEVWPQLESEALASNAPFFIFRPGSSTLIPEGDIMQYEEELPAEALGRPAPPSLGVVSADFGL